MNLKNFKSGNYVKQYGYSSFSPSKINVEWTWDEPEINSLLAEANQKLGELNAFSLYAPDIDIFISMHVVKEATLSNRIEGTKTEIEDAVLEQKNIDPEKRDDWSEVQNYIESMNQTIKGLKKLPLSGRLLKEAHKTLMKGVRGKQKLPGEYRTSQNWIGGATLKDAAFVPPVHKEVPELMSDLEKFLHNKYIHVPHLIRIALAHYQFETIHPFLDGNGRVGRLLITLYLVSEELLEKPVLYLSYFFEKNKSLYYDNLSLVRKSNDLTQWVKFFLVAVIETSNKGIDTLKKILDLKEKIESEILDTFGKRIGKARILLNHLFRHPIVDSKAVSKLLKITQRPANEIINKFIELGILKEITGFKRNRLFEFEKYLNLFRKD